MDCCTYCSRNEPLWRSFEASQSWLGLRRVNHYLNGWRSGLFWLLDKRESAEKPKYYNFWKIRFKLSKIIGVIIKRKKHSLNHFSSFKTTSYNHIWMMIYKLRHLTSSIIEKLHVFYINIKHDSNMCMCRIKCTKIL